MRQRIIIKGYSHGGRKDARRVSIMIPTGMGILTDFSETDSDGEELLSGPVALTKLKDFSNSCSYVSRIVENNDCWFEFCDPDDYSHLPEYNHIDGLSLNNHYQYFLFRELAFIFRGNCRELSNITTTIFGFLFNMNNYWNMGPNGYSNSNLPYYADERFYKFNELWFRYTFRSAFNVETCIEVDGMIGEKNSFLNYPLEKVDHTLSKAVINVVEEACMEDRNLERELKSFLQPINEKIEEIVRENIHTLGGYRLSLDCGRSYNHDDGRSRYSHPYHYDPATYY